MNKSVKREREAFPGGRYRSHQERRWKPWRRRAVPRATVRSNASRRWTVFPPSLPSPTRYALSCIPLPNVLSTLLSQDGLSCRSTLCSCYGARLSCRVFSLWRQMKKLTLSLSLSLSLSLTIALVRKWRIVGGAAYPGSSIRLIRSFVKVVRDPWRRIRIQMKEFHGKHDKFHREWLLPHLRSRAAREYHLSTFAKNKGRFFSCKFDLKIGNWNDETRDLS